MNGPQPGNAAPLVEIIDVVLDHPATAFPPLPAGATRAFVIVWLGGNVVSTSWESLADTWLPEQQRRIEDSAAWRRWQDEHTPPPTQPSIPVSRASVVVCTRDRTDDLTACLDSLEAHASEALEIIVVDSCPSDDRTRVLLQQRPRVRYVLEPRPGAALARNRGIELAQGQVVAFTDDDATVGAGWLEALLRPMDDPTVAVVTGLGLPAELTTASQEWFERISSFIKGYERREFSLADTAPLGAGNAGASVNMAVRVAALHDIGVFDEVFGPGTPAKAGEDHEFLYRTVLAGHRIVYEPAAIIRHRHRRDWEALSRAAESYGIAVYAWWCHALLHHHDLQVLKVAPRWFWHNEIKGLIRSLRRRPGALPTDLALAGLRGALHGPSAYFRTRRVMHSLGSRRAGDVTYRPVTASTTAPSHGTSADQPTVGTS